MFTDTIQSLEVVLPYLDTDTPLSVADLGCGSGEYVYSLAKVLAEKSRIYGVDVQKGLLERIDQEKDRLGVENIITVWSDIEVIGATKIPEHSLDLVVVANVLFQAENKSSLLTEAARLLKPGGYIFVVDWQDSFDGMGPQQANVITKAEAVELLADNKFSVKTAVDKSDHHYAIVATI